MEEAVIIPFFFFIGFIALMIILRVIAGGMDKDRITDDIRSRGGKVIRIEWRMFGPGWFGSQYSRIYEVRYEDRDGDIRAAYCKTSLLGGIYWSDDRITSRGRREPGEYRDDYRQEDIEDENRRLREENRKLKDRLDRFDDRI
ncbi:MAG: hypothetical protein ACYS8W_10735 [Planctomycetota bacterium]|jgi:hypothetical protein